MKSVAAFALVANALAFASAAEEEMVGTLVNPSAIATNVSTSSTNGSAVHISGYDSACLCAQNTDFIGGDMRSVPSSTASTCCYHCHRYGCVAYTWTDYQGGTCWLKNSVGKTKNYIGATGCIIGKDMYEEHWSRYSNCDMPGNDLWGGDGDRVPLERFGECEANCWNHDFCKAVTWTDYEGGTCWYKRAVTNCAKYPGAFTSVMFNDYTM